MLGSIVASSFYRWRTRRSSLAWLLVGVICASVGAAIELFGGGRVAGAGVVFSTSGLLVVFLHSAISGSAVFKNDFVANILTEYGSRSKVLVGEIVCIGVGGVVHAFFQMIADALLLLTVLLVVHPSSLVETFVFGIGQAIVGLILFVVASGFIAMFGGLIGFALRSSVLPVLVVLVIYLGFEPVLTSLLAAWGLPNGLVNIAPSAAVDSLIPGSWSSIGSLGSLVCWIGLSGVVAWVSFRTYKP